MKNAKIFNLLIHKWLEYELKNFAQLYIKINLFLTRSLADLQQKKRLQYYRTGLLKDKLQQVDDLKSMKNFFEKGSH